MFRLLLLAAIASAQDYIPAVFRDFSGGLNDNTPAISLPANESPKVENVVIDEPIGALKSRNGFIVCGVLPSGNAPTSLFEYFKSDGTNRMIVTDNQNYYQTADCSVYNTITTGQSSSAQPSFAIVRDKLWITNRSTHVITWDGTTATLLAATAGTPNPAPPRGNYLEFWKERVWIARSDSNPSGVAFSALTDTNGNTLDPSTGTLSWPALNLIQVAQNSGSPIYGIKVYRDNLYVFKNNGIWKILFEDEFRVAVVKTYSSVGCRFNDAIWEVDGILYFLGPDGVYAFDGESSVRISDKMLNLFQSLNQPLTNNQFKTWTSGTDFGAGTLVNTTTQTLSGSVTLSLTNFDDFSDGNFTTGPRWEDFSTAWVISSNSLRYANASTVGLIGSTSTATNGIWQADLRLGRVSDDYMRWHIMASTTNVDNSSSGYYLELCMSGSCSIGVGLYKLPSSFVPVQLAYSSENLDASTHTYKITKNGGSFEVYRDNSLLLTANDTTPITSSVGLGFEVTAGGPPIPEHYADNIYVGISSYGYITSDSHNAVTVSSWSTFAVTDTRNGGGVSYQVKVATNAGALFNASFSSITAGALIAGGTSQVVIQWRATLTQSTDSAKSPSLEDVTVNYTQGGVNTQLPFARGWKNRLWISASSGSATTDNVVMVKSKTTLPAWVPYTMQIGPMVKFNDNFYAGASTWSAIYRMDYGASDAGAPIPIYWESRDESWGAPNTSKNLMELYADFQKGGGANTQIGYSRDNGASFSSKTLDLSGSGRGVKRFFVNGGNSTVHRVRITNSTLDQTLKIYGVELFAAPYKLREN